MLRSIIKSIDSVQAGHLRSGLSPNTQLQLASCSRVAQISSTVPSQTYPPDCTPALARHSSISPALPEHVRHPALSMADMLPGGGGGMVGQFPLEQWFYEMPVCTRWWMTAALSASLLVQCRIVSPFQLFYSFRTVFVRSQVRHHCCDSSST